MRKFRSKRAENFRKLLKNITKLSKKSVKRLKIFEGFSTLLQALAQICALAPLRRRGGFLPKLLLVPEAAMRKHKVLRSPVRDEVNKTIIRTAGSNSRGKRLCECMKGGKMTELLQFKEDFDIAVQPEGEKY